MADRKLDFLYIGPQRTASSWLHKRLERHPQLVFPKNVKETMFLDQYFNKGWDWYWSHFDLPSQEQKVGEIAPTCIELADGPERLKGSDGLKVIIGVRDPVERTFSNFRHYRSRGLVPNDYFEAVKRIPSIETSGRYAEHCPRWDRAFGEHVHYVVQEDIADDPQLEVDRICDFIGVDRIKLNEADRERYGAAMMPRFAFVAKAGTIAAQVARSLRLNSAVEFAKWLGLRRLLLGAEMGEEQMPEDVRQHLINLHRDDIAFLKDRLGRQFDNWGDS